MLKSVRRLIIMSDHIRVPLTQGQVAIIDLDDMDIVEPYSWCARKYGRSNTLYAWRNSCIDGKQRGSLMHRAIMSPPDGMQTDHINGDGLDNRRCNLRIATCAENNRNTHKRTDNTSGFKGVSYRERNRKFIAYVSVDGKQEFLGYYTTAEDAAHAYDAAARVLYGEFAKLNFKHEELMT